MISKKPRKQRKSLYNASLHTKQNLLAGHLSPELRKKYTKRSITLRKGDSVKVMRGQYAGKSGKISLVNLGKQVIHIGDILRKKKDGSEIAVKFNSSNLLVTDLNLEDDRRLKHK